MNLNQRELRVLGCLIEKSMTTPDYYPMTINALQTACNQKSNRDPVVDYAEDEVVRAIDELRSKGLARTVHGKGDRALKYRHVVAETLEVSPPQAALLAVMMLRGPQTLGELRSRTGRYTEFPDLDAIAAELQTLATAEEPLAEMLPRRPGEKEPRYRHLLSGEEPVAMAVDEMIEEAAVDRVAVLEGELAELRERVARMERELGLDP
ncbi:MAG: YceH family protein [Acidimicrobiia bacterium]|nr:YceH family protein [Acidimicrobiia bacterium]